MRSGGEHAARLQERRLTRKLVRRTLQGVPAQAGYQCIVEVRGYPGGSQLCLCSTHAKQQSDGSS